MDKSEQMATMMNEAFGKMVDKKLEKLIKALKLDERLAAIEAQGDANTKLASLERRASRQGDHLQRLEDRVRALEGK